MRALLSFIRDEWWRHMSLREGLCWLLVFVVGFSLIAFAYGAVFVTEHMQANYVCTPKVGS